MATSSTKEVSAASATESGSASSSDVIGNGVKLVGEKFIPGASLLLDGKVGSGALHVAAGFAGRALLGPAGWFLVAANSYTTSCTDKSLYEHVVGSIRKKQS